jgi:hypothetical protein
MLESLWVCQALLLVEECHQGLVASAQFQHLAFDLVALCHLQCCQVLCFLFHYTLRFRTGHHRGGERADLDLLPVHRIRTAVVVASAVPGNRAILAELGRQGRSGDRTDDGLIAVIEVDGLPGSSRKILRLGLEDQEIFAIRIFEG